MNSSPQAQSVRPAQCMREVRHGEGQLSYRTAPRRGGLLRRMCRRHRNGGHSALSPCDLGGRPRDSVAVLPFRRCGERGQFPIPHDGMTESLIPDPSPMYPTLR